MNGFDINIIIKAIPYIISGLKITLFISFASSVLALAIGVSIAFFRTSEISALKYISAIYVEVIRNTPLLIQLYIFYKGLPNIGINLSPILCGILSLSIYTGAFISEVIRSGINSIAPEQREAAKALGFSQLQVFKLIIFPQALRIIIPPLGSQFINLVKNSSLVSFITVTDVFYVIYRESENSFRFFEFFVVGVVIYMALSGIISLFVNFLERKLSIRGRMASI